MLKDFFSYFDFFSRYLQIVIMVCRQTINRKNNQQEKRVFIRCVQNELLTIQLVLCRYQKMVYSDYEKGTKETPKLLSSIPEDYICSLCRCEDGQFDFLIEIERLREVGSLIKA